MRFLYLLYVIRTTSLKTLLSHARFFAQRSDQSTVRLLGKALWGLLRYEVHPMEFFCLKFHEHPEAMAEHASTLFMFRFHRSQNQRKARACFQNKVAFLNVFSRFARRRYIEIGSQDSNRFHHWLLESKPAHVMAKKPFGACGRGVKKLHLDYRPEPIFLPEHRSFEDSFKNLVADGFRLVEEFVVQHPTLAAWNPSCVNTIRMVTMRDPNGQPLLFEAILRLGTGASVDNLSSGGIAIHIDSTTGMTQGRGFRMEPSDEEFVDVHPITHVPLNGLAIPHWQEALAIVMEAATLVPGAGTVGWDVAITPEGPCLIEGNDNWGVIIVEKSLGRGVRKDLEKVMQSARPINRGMRGAAQGMAPIGL